MLPEYREDKQKWQSLQDSSTIPTMCERKNHPGKKKNNTVINN
jgi:hypothetical protein